jgi:hypothetical protein
MKKMLTMAIMAIALTCTAHSQQVQDYKLINGHWVPYGQPYTPADTPTTIHGYSWKGNTIVAVQDYKLVNGKWLPYGAPYPMPMTA